MLGFYKAMVDTICQGPFYDYIFIHRETSPIGPPVFEWAIAKIFKRSFMILTMPSDTKYFFCKPFYQLAEGLWKVKHICRWAYKITAGNDYLYHYAIQFNQSNQDPYADTEKGSHEIKHHREGILSVGWTGSHSTLKYLDQIIPVINELQKEIDFNFLVIADKNPFLPLRNFQFIPWNSSTEQEDLLKLDIGVMPLVADAWSEGKCGFKLIQYYAGGIPAVASPVGINKIIVEHEVNGFVRHE
jgi:glycosyltransferase involved in cell wall biosynthesis